MNFFTYHYMIYNVINGVDLITSFDLFQFSRYGTLCMYWQILCRRGTGKSFMRRFAIDDDPVCITR